MADPECADVETSSDAYARRFSGAVGTWFLQRQSDCTSLMLAGLRPGARVLEVGGGHAQLVPLLVSLGLDVTVIGSRASCGARLAPWLDQGRVHFDAGDLLALPYPARSYDAVLCFRLLPHIENWPRLLSELCRVADARVIVDYPSARGINILADRLFAAKKKIEGDTRPFTVFSPATIAASFAGHGFRVAGQRGQFFFPMAMHRAVGRAGWSRLLERGAELAGLTALLGSPRIVRADRS